MPPRKKLHRKGHSIRIKKYEEEIDHFGLYADSTLNVEELVSERRKLMAATCTACLALFVWIVALGSSYWVTIDGGPNGIYMNHTKVTYFHGHMGLFQMCRSVIRHSWSDGKPSQSGMKEECRYFYVNPNKNDYATDSMLDRTILEYTRSQIAFSCLSILLILMAVAFSLYTFTQPRYMFKRLAGAVHFIAAGVKLVMIEIASNTARYEQEHFHMRHPPQASWAYGVSYFFGWICFSAYVAVGTVFVLYSRKRKLDVTADQEFSLS